MCLGFKDYISLFAIGISTISLFFSLYDKKIKLGAQLFFDGEEHSIEIYNNSNRQVTISFLLIYKAKFKRFSKRQYAYTWYENGDSINFVIPSYGSKNIKFNEIYSLNGFIKNSKGNGVFITLFVSGKKRNTIKLC
jgi:hypothetical protein